MLTRWNLYDNVYMFGVRWRGRGPMPRDGVEIFKLHRTRYFFTSDILLPLSGRESEINLQEG
jgi:hypothetical protein